MRQATQNRCIKACSNEANIVQHYWANNVAQCWTKFLSKFKIKPTSSNIVFKRGQHVTYPTNNVG